MYSSETFGRLFWVDDDFEFRSCPLNVNGTGDFECDDYVSEWTDWEGVDIPLLLAIHKCELLNKTQYAGSLSLNDRAHKVIDKEVNMPKKETDKMVNYTWNEDFYNEIVKDYNYRFPKFNVNNYPSHLGQD